MKHKALLVLLPSAVLVCACDEPRFEFRGYSDISNCRQVIDAELANGSFLMDIFDAPDPESTDVITELMTEIYGREIAIEVACQPQGEVSWVHYVATEQEPRETDEIYERYGTELESLLGAPTEHATGDSRSLHFLCSKEAPIVLEEYRREPELLADGTTGAERHEVYLAVIPSNSGCIAEPP
jgi:hypothetical protein